MVLLREEDRTHPAVRDSTHDAIAAETAQRPTEAALRRHRLREQRGFELAVEIHAAFVGVFGQESPDSAAQGVVLTARLVQVCAPRVARELDGLLEDGLQAGVLLGIHQSSSPVSSHFKNARAMRHSRCTVRVLTSSTWAISSS